MGKQLVNHGVDSEVPLILQSESHENRILEELTAWAREEASQPTVAFQFFGNAKLISFTIYK